jgi:DUF4097 and DUF4098 domain-containing protein YvlB
MSLFDALFGTPSRPKAISGSLTISSSQGVCRINGKSYHGSSINIVNGQVVVDGKTLDQVDGSAPINVTIQGSCGEIRLDQGDIVVAGDVDGDVQTGQGDIDCRAVHGSCQTDQGDIRCGAVGGSCTTGMGDIHHG